MFKKNIMTTRVENANDYNIMSNENESLRPFKSIE